MRARTIGWLKSRRGNVAILFALMLPLLLGAAAFGVETTIWYQARLKLQDQADAAAFSGATEKKRGSGNTLITAAATKAAADNGFNAAEGSIAVNSPPTSGSGGANAVEVILNTTTPRYFSALFTATPVSLHARAVARFTQSGQACVLALSSTASGAVTFSGSSSMTLTGCSVTANSTSTTAILTNGNATAASADCMYTPGGVSLNSHVSLTCGAAVTGVSAVTDPFAGLDVPSDPGACKTVSGSSLTAGNYCSGFSLNGGTTTLAAGTYIISGGQFKLNGNATLNGTGVTFYIKSGVSISINGNSTLNLSAPTTGPYAGMLFFGDRSNTATQSFNGTNTSHLTGNLYFAGGTVAYSGNFAGTNGCTQIVSDKVDWTGNSTFSADCSAYGMGTIPATNGSTVLSE